MDRTINTTVGSLLFLLLLSLFAVSITPVVQGTETSMIWGSRFSQTYEEILAASDACNYIINHFVWYMSYNWVYNGYGSGTTQANVYSCTSSCNNNYDHSVVFYTGHGWNLTYISGAYHYHVYADNSNTWAQGIQDSGIHSRTTGGTHYFAFIWACFQGNAIGYDHPSGGVGMPHAWTQRTNLNLDGYHNNDGTSHCWIGFKETSPPLHYSAGPYGYEYGNFVKYFYYHATYHKSTIRKSLNDASLWVFGVPFDQSPLWQGFTWYSPEHGRNMTGWMKVYGNSWNPLPY